MRVITGSAKGRRLKTLDGDDVRPTTDRIKEAVFSVLQFNIEGRRFLDLFAGSGQMGIEALSRGAEQAVFVDSGREAIRVITENLQGCGLFERARVLNLTAQGFLQLKNQNFDIVFLDPPYYSGLIEENLEAVEKITSKSGYIVCEAPLDEELPEKINEFVLNKNYRYGKIKISVYCHPDFIG